MSFTLKETKMFNADSIIQKAHSAAFKGMEKAATQFEADTKMLTHVDSDSLRRSWTHSVEDSGSKIEGAVGSNLEYAPYEDDYHGNLTTAINNNIKSYFNIVVNEIKSVK